jgi:myo-inositol-1(or 4)-monophosphatase
MKFKWAREAEICLKAVGGVAGMLDDKTGKRVAIREKESSRDVVTEMDVAIEKYLRKHLAESAYPVIGEEFSPNVVAQGDGCCWFLDPIDGTANYLNNIPLYGTSVGFMAGLRFEVGAVVFPALRELFFVSDCGEAYLNGARLRPKKGVLKDALIGVSFSGKAWDPKGRAKEFELFGSLNDKSRGCMRTGSAALNVCYVAAGKMQGAVGFNNKIWDVAGALAVARAAGYKLLCNAELAANRISYVIGCEGVVEVMASEIESSMNIRLRSIEETGLL